MQVGLDVSSSLATEHILPKHLKGNGKTMEKLNKLSVEISMVMELQILPSKGIATTLLTIVTYTSHLEKAMVVFTYN